MATQSEDNIIDNNYEDNYKKSSSSRKVKIEGSSRVDKYKVHQKDNVIEAPDNIFKKKVKMTSSSSMKDIEDIKKNGNCL